MKKFTHAEHYILNTHGFKLADLFSDVGSFATACAILWTVDERTTAETPDEYAKTLPTEKSFHAIIGEAVKVIEEYLPKPNAKPDDSDQESAGIPLVGTSESETGSLKPDDPPMSSGG